MKKDKATRKAQLKAALKRQLKSLIGPVIILMIILAGVLVIALYREKEEQREIIKVNSYNGDKKTFTLESDELLFELDAKSTQFTVQSKTGDAIWYSNPENASKDPAALKLEKEKLQSTLLLTYTTMTGVDTLFNNYAYSMEKGIYDIEQGEDYVKVMYSIGDTDKEFVIPTLLDEARYKEYTGKMDNSTAARVSEYYKKYDINNLGKRDNKEELLEKYPMLADTIIYVLRDTTKDNIKGKLEGYFADAGYTVEDFEADKALVSGEGSTSSKPVFNISMIYRLEGNELVVEIPFDEMEFPHNYPIYYLSVLPYFGAGGTDETGALLVPEGGGALIQFNNGKIAQNRYFANLYGWDHALSREAVVHETEVYFNGFGVIKENGSFLCIMEEGAPYGGVAADISGKLNSYNYVYPQYNLIHREDYEMGDRAAGHIYLYEQNIPAGERIVQRYCFSDSDSYVDLANEYRDYLLENHSEFMAMNEDTSTPVAVEILGAIDKVKQVLGVPVSKPLTLTTFQEAQEMLAELTEAGLDNLSVKLSGWMNGGVQQKILKSVHVESDLGGKKQLQKLIDYANENGIDIYLNGITNYAYDSDILDGFFSFTDSARFINRDRAAIHPYSTVTFAERERQDPHYLLKASLITKMINNLAEAAADYGAGVSFEDVGRELNSDFNRKDVVTRQMAYDSQVQQIQELREAGTKFMINMGNNYMVPYTDFVTNMDLSGSVYTIIDQTVPLYQMAIHGYVNYAGESLNLTQNREQLLLESAEYGAGLAFTLMDETAFTLQDTLYTKYFGAQYDSWKDELTAIYARYNEDLGHTFNQKMVDHKKLSELLSCTEYEDGTKVYVNYSYQDTKLPDGQVLSARDYVVVK